MNKTLIAAGMSAALVLGACSADKTDFKAAAEKTIRKNVEDNTDGKAKADCDNPGSTKIGTTFDCVATAGDGSQYSYSAEITGKKQVTVNFVAAIDPASTGGTLPTEDSVSS